MLRAVSGGVAGRAPGRAGHLRRGRAQRGLGRERARLGLARALLADKPVLVLDEPTAHLDTATAREVAEDLLAACQDRALVWITHDGVGLDRMHGVVDLDRSPALSRT